MAQMTALGYVKKELGLTMQELKDLPKADVEILKDWAVNEMKACKEDDVHD